MDRTNPAHLDFTGAPVFLDQEQASALRADLEMAREHVLEAVRFGEDRGWAPIGADGAAVPHDQLVSMGDQVRALSRTHPLMVRAKNVRAAYTFGEGVTISVPTDDDNPAASDVADVVRNFVEDPGNAAAWFGHAAAMASENRLFDGGEVFAGHWVNAQTGDVRVRRIPARQITRVVTAPGDPDTPHYYLRAWVDGTVQREAWYPALDYAPVAMPKMLEGRPVLWPGTRHPTHGNGAAIQHVAVNTDEGTAGRGIGDGWPAVAWGRRYADFLADTAALYESLTKIARHISGTDRTKTARVAAMASAGSAGGTLYTDSDAQVRTPSFAGVDPRLGRPYAAMIAAAVGLPVTVLTADPGQEGARAVAQTLDRPMELLFMARQRVWADAWRASILFKLRAAAEAPSHPLRVKVAQVGDRRMLDWGGTPGPAINIDFPAITEDDTTAVMDALVKAHSTGLVPNEDLLRGLLLALRVEDVDDIMARATNEDGEWVDPNVAAADAAGLAAMRAARQGADL